MDALDRRLDGDVIEHLRERRGVAARDLDRLRVDGTRPVGLRIKLLAREDLARRVRPVFREDRLHLVHDRPRDADLRVAPFARVAGVSKPALLDPEATRERHLPVHNEDLAMGPLAHLVDREESDGPVLAPVDTGLLQRLAQIAQLAPPGIDQEADLDAPPCRLDHGVGELLSGLVRLKDVCLQVDARLRLPDRRGHRRKNLVAVLQQLRRVARSHGRPERVERAAESRVGDGEGMIELVDVPLLGPDEVAEHRAAGGAEQARRRETEKRKAERATHAPVSYSRSLPEGRPPESSAK